MPQELRKHPPEGGSGLADLPTILEQARGLCVDMQAFRIKSKTGAIP